MPDSSTPAFVLGFIAAVMPGPLQSFLLLQTLQRGPRAGLWIVPSPLLSDGPIIAVCLLVLNRAGDGLLRGLALCGGLFLVYLAADSWRSLRRPQAAVDEEPHDVAAAGSGWKLLARAVTINFLGPGPWIFWGTVMGPLLVQQWRLSPSHGLAFLATFYGTLVGVLTVELLLFSFARRLGPRIARAGTWLGLVLVVVFAALLVLYGSGVIDRYGL